MRNLAAAAQRAAGLPSNGVQGMVIERKALDELVQRLASLPAAERSSIPGIKPARADLILAGAVVVQGVLRAGGFDGLETTEAGLREGVFFERLLAGSGPALGASGAEADRSPLFEDVRRTSVLNLAARYHVDVAHTRHVAALALGMFDELARLGLHDGDARERELLWAASMLHDIGMSVDYDDHHKHSRYLILNGGLPGFSPVEVAIVAQAARYHRKGMPEPGPLEPLFGEGDAARLDRCAVLLRLAEDLERSRDQLVRGNALHAGERRCEGVQRSPRWRAQRRCRRSGRDRAAPDRRRRVGRPALGRGPRDRALRARLPQPPVCGRLKRTAAPLGVQSAYSAASSRSRPAQSNSTRVWRTTGPSCHSDAGNSRQAFKTAAVARLPPRVENSPPRTT